MTGLDQGRCQHAVHGQALTACSAHEHVGCLDIERTGQHITAGVVVDLGGPPTDRSLIGEFVGGLAAHESAERPDAAATGEVTG